MNNHNFWELLKGRMNVSAWNSVKNNYIWNFQRKKYFSTTYMVMCYQLCANLATMCTHTRAHTHVITWQPRHLATMQPCHEGRQVQFDVDYHAGKSHHNTWSLAKSTGLQAFIWLSQNFSIFWDVHWCLSKNGNWRVFWLSIMILIFKNVYIIYT